VVRSSSLRVRPAGADEVDGVAHLDREATGVRDRRSELSAAELDGRLLVAERRAEIVGYAMHGRFLGYDFLELLVVRPDARRTGVATALVGAVESRATTGKLFTSTNQSNLPMRRLCRRLGFEPSGWVDNLDDGDPELFFVKRL
jgi:GNAT superfamily N-acetyltransferase